MNTILLRSKQDYKLKALIGTDYSLSATTLTIPAGSSSASITINEGAANNADEPTELIALTAALAGSEEDARIKSSQKTLSIDLIDDDETKFIEKPLPGFIAHRHSQSVLSILAKKINCNFLSAYESEWALDMNRKRTFNHLNFFPINAFKF